MCRLTDADLKQRQSLRGGVYVKLSTPVHLGGHPQTPKWIICSYIFLTIIFIYEERVGDIETLGLVNFAVWTDVQFVLNLVQIHFWMLPQSWDDALRMTWSLSSSMLYGESGVLRSVIQIPNTAISFVFLDWSSFGHFVVLQQNKCLSCQDFMGWLWPAPRGTCNMSSAWQPPWLTAHGNRPALGWVKVCSRHGVTILAQQRSSRS